MTRRANQRDAEPALPAPGDGLVLVVIRAGHRHRGVHFEVDTPYAATPEEADKLARFGALAGDT